MQPSPEGSSSNASDHFALNFQVLRPSKCHGENSLKAERGGLGTHWLSSQNYLEKCSCTVVCSIRGKELSSLSHLSSILLASRPCVAWSTSPGCKQYWVADEHRLIALLLREPQLLEEVGAQLSLKCLSLGLFCQQEALLTRTCFWLVTGRLWANMLPWKLENAKLWLDSSIVKKEYQSSSICSYPWPRGCVPVPRWVGCQPVTALHWTQVHGRHGRAVISGRTAGKCCRGTADPPHCQIPLQRGLLGVWAGANPLWFWGTAPQQPEKSASMNSGPTSCPPTGTWHPQRWNCEVQTFLLVIPPPDSHRQTGNGMTRAMRLIKAMETVTAAEQRQLFLNRPHPPVILVLMMFLA